jgi:hypothetical protein
MSDDSTNLWYQLGKAVEEARARPTTDRVKALGEKLAAFRAGGQGSVSAGTRRSPGDRSGDTAAGTALVRRGRGGEDAEGLDWLLTALSGGLAARLIVHWRPRSEPGPGLLLRGAAAGAATAILQELVTTIFADDEAPGRAPAALFNRALAGSARGLVYAALLEPRLPGPPVLRGAVFATLEYVLSPLGGLGRILGKAAPWGSVPVLRELFAADPADEDSYLEQLVFGIALALMAGETFGRDD